MHEQQKDVSPFFAAKIKPQNPPFLIYPHSMTMQKQPTCAFLIETQIMQRCSNSLVGCIISRATASPAKSVLLSTSRNLSAQVRLVKNNPSCIVHANTWQTKVMHKAGICLADVTCHSRSTQRRTRPISKPSIETDGTQHSGARLAFCITRSTSTEMHLMPTPVRYA